MTNDKMRERLAELTRGLPKSFWPEEARKIERQLWGELKGRGLMYVLEQHDELGHWYALAVSADKAALELWKEFLDRQGDNSPAKAAGQFFEISEIPIIRTGEPPSITRAREILELKEWE